MKEQSMQMKKVLRGNDSDCGQRQDLYGKKADLTVLIYELEHNKSLNSPPWQIDSLRKSLREVETRIRIGYPGKGWKQHEREHQSA